MIRLHAVVEGQTEWGFIDNVLKLHLAPLGVYADARCVETSRDRRKSRIFRGGVVRYEKIRNDIIHWIRQDRHPDVWFTSMFDLYRFPNDSPGYEDAMRMHDPYQRVAHLEHAMAADIRFDRFVPYIQLHEYEALLLSAPHKFADFFLNRGAETVRLANEVAGNNPELIDQGETTAPSKRIIKHIPEYEDQKTSAGPQVAEMITLPVIRQSCLHFRLWLEHLEKLDAANRRGIPAVDV